jgi:hypothetical protein
VNTGLRTWFDKAGPLGQSLSILAVVAALLVLGFAVWRGVRALRGKKAADVLTVVAAAMASSVAATGMWHFFSRTMHLPIWIQATLFAFMEISVLASALRARANVARDGQAGADGLAVWILTSASGLMSASEAASPQEALVRLGAPLVAAWLWERSMVPERRAKKAAQGTAEAAVRWLFSVKRIAVRLGLATALGADLETEDANRRIDRFVRADNRAQRAGRLTRSRTTKRRDRAHARLMEQARMQADPRALYAHLGRQAILDVLARLGGDDAVIDRERARQMQHILADATGDTSDGEATPGTGSETGGATSDASSADPAANPPTFAAPPAPPRPAPGFGIPATAAPQPATAPYPPAPRDRPMTPQPNGRPVPAPAAATPQTPQLAPLQDELPLQLPVEALRAAQASNGAANGAHIPGARHGSHAAAATAANGQPINVAIPGPPLRQASAAANRNGAARAARAQTPRPQQPQTPAEPARYAAAPLPAPEPEPEPAAYAYFEADPEPEYEPEPPQPEPLPEPLPQQSLLPRPPAAVATPLIDQQLAARITKAMAASRIPPNLLKLANDLGISPALMQDTIDAMGGFNALWSQVRQDQDAETPEANLEFYTA